MLCEKSEVGLEWILGCMNDCRERIEGSAWKLYVTNGKGEPPQDTTMLLFVIHCDTKGDSPKAVFNVSKGVL